jgi:hypothetical protein
MFISAFSLLTLSLVLFGTSVLAVAPIPDNCDPNCESVCKKWTMHTLRIDGNANYQLTSSITLKVSYDGQDVCAEERHECGLGSCDFRWTCNEGWSFYLPSQAMEGPWAYDLQGLPFERYHREGSANMDVSMDDIECDAWQCGGTFEHSRCYTYLGLLTIIMQVVLTL